MLTCKLTYLLTYLFPCRCLPNNRNAPGVASWSFAFSKNHWSNLQTNELWVKQVSKSSKFVYVILYCLLTVYLFLLLGTGSLLQKAVPAAGP